MESILPDRDRQEGLMKESRMTRRRFMKAGLGALASAAAYPTLRPAGHARARGDPPNVVYIFADQLRACSVGCYDNVDIRTPRIDQVAGQGTLFANAISTSPMCTPHRACLMTGRYPTATGVVSNGDRLARDEECLAEVFQQHGYRTGYIGKWHLNGPTIDPREDPGWVPPPARQGFRFWLGFNYAHV
jgi:arylsulfatase A-like enzyme